MLPISRLLTYALIAIAVFTAGLFVFVQFESASNSYGGELVYSFQREPPTYDYSCDEPVYELYVTLTNNGTKLISDFKVSISNPLCVGAVPSTLTQQVLPKSTVSFYLSSTNQNGTIIVSGNNTFVQIRF